MKQTSSGTPSGLKIIREPDRHRATKAGVEQLREAGASEQLLRHARRALGREAPQADADSQPEQ